MRKILLIMFFIIPILTFSQDAKYEIGTRNSDIQRYNGGFYDYSVPGGVNIKVSVWGFVRYPGKYIVPNYTNVLDLLSYAGGPNEEAHLDELRIIRINPDSTQAMLKFNLEDYSWNDALSEQVLNVPELKAGDILSVPGSQKYYLRDWLSMALSIFSALISLAILLTR